MKTLVFQGDSITDCGRLTCGGAGYPKLDMGPGYAGLIASHLWGKYPAQWNILNRGVSGDRIVDLYARWKRDLLNLKPDLVSMLVGINDVGHEFAHGNGVERARFDEFYRRLLDWTLESCPGVKFILIEPFVFHCEGLNENYYPEMPFRQEIVRKIAADYGTVFLPMQEVFNKMLETTEPGYWSPDGIHLMPSGHWLLAKTWLDAVEKAGLLTKGFNK